MLCYLFYIYIFWRGFNCISYKGNKQEHFSTFYKAISSIPEQVKIYCAALYIGVKT